MSWHRGELPDALLVERCLAGDGDAWEELLRRFRMPLLQRIRRRLGSGSRDLDRVEDILSRLWESLVVEDYRRLRDYDPNRAPLRRYLAALVRQLVAQDQRTAAHRPRQVPEGGAEDVVDRRGFPWPEGQVPASILALLTPREQEYLEQRLLAPPETVPPWPFSRAYAVQLERRIEDKIRRYLVEHGSEGILE